MALTVRKAERLKKPGKYGDAFGLYLKVNPGGTKSWMLRVEKDGREYNVGLGAYVDYTLEEARDRAWELRREIKNGFDPTKERREYRAKRQQEIAEGVARLKRD